MFNKIKMNEKQCGVTKCLCWYLLQSLRRRAGSEGAAPLGSASHGCPSAFEQSEVASGLRKRRHTEVTLFTDAGH